MSPAEFYDYLESMDWDDAERVIKAEKISSRSLEHRMVYINMTNWKRLGKDKPPRPTH